jgi:hypothetical protein
MKMGYVNSEKEPELIYVGNDQNELDEIKRWVNNLNRDLVDSGFDQYKYNLDVVGDKAYVKRV